MEKRTPGTPLTDAERRQRQDAARARWAHRGIAAAIGATAGLSLAQAAIERRAAHNLRTVLNAYDAARAPEIARHRAKDALIQLNGLRAQARVKSKWPVPAMRAALFQDKRTAAAKLRAGEAEVAPYRAHEDLVRQSLADDPPVPEEALGDLWGHMREFRGAAESVADLATPARDMAAAQRRIDALADARKTRKVARAGRTYTLPPHTREIVLGREVREKFRADLEAFNAGQEDLGREAAETGEYIGELNRKPPAHWFKPVVRRVDVNPREGINETAPHRVRVPGTLDPKKIRAMRTELVGRIQAHTALHRAAEELRHNRVMANIRPEVAARWAPTGRFKLLALGAGAVGGALAGLAAARVRESEKKKKLQKSFASFCEEKKEASLAKADDDAAPDQPGNSGDLAGVSAATEGKLAQNIAGTLRVWKDDAAASLGTPSGQTLHDRMVSDLDRATRPLDQVMQTSASTPIPAVVPGHDGGDGRTILVSMGARGPEMERFIRDYREDRIVALADDQRAAIQDLLINAARAGASPDEMARQIRQTIGLTPGQAQAVLRYRGELEHLQPAALRRGLRDKRFDSVIDRAVNDAGTLTQAQIDRAVDGYHRKLLAYRSMVIARTEGVGAANNAYVASVLPFLSRNPSYTVVKTWNAEDDERTRHDHRGLNRQSVVGLYTPFRCDSGKTIRWPHDPQADADETIQCRCTLHIQLVPRALAAKMGTSSVKPFTPAPGTGKGDKPSTDDGELEYA